MRLGLSSGLSTGGFVPSSYPNSKSMAFDGTDDQVLLPFALPSTWTVSFWFKQSDTANGEYLWDSRNSSDQAFAAWTTYHSGTNSHVVTVWCGSTVVGTTKIPVGTWAHVGVTKSGNTVSIYVDGVFDHSGTNPTFATSTTSDIKVGTRYNGANAWAGNIDEFAVWNTALDADAVSALYSSGSPTDVSVDSGDYDSSADLQGWWRMGDATEPAADGTNDYFIFDQQDKTLGSELIVNGTFDSNVTSWSSSSGGTVTWSSGTAITGAVGTDDRGGMSQTFTTVNGAVYQLSFDVISRTSTKWEVYRQGTGAGTIIEGTALGSHSIFFTAASTSTELAFYAKQAGTSDGTVAWDNISVKKVNGATATMNNMVPDNIEEDTP